LINENFLTQILHGTLNADCRKGKRPKEDLYH
jgi:hypothetical protein